jgi:quercetin dioxygenase-like cupin family protein
MPVCDILKGRTMALSKGWALVALCVLAVSARASAEVSETRMLRLPQDIQFSASSASQTLTLYGDPMKPGMYVYRSRIAAGSKNMPHWHSGERTATVLSGTLYYGLGEQWDESKLIAFPPGTFFSVPPKMPHFAWAKDGEVILQVTGIGPAGTTVIQPTP